MSILLTCKCGKKLKVGDDKIGKKVKCPGCQAILSVPAAAADDDPEPPVKAKSKPAPPPPEDEADEDEAIEPPAKSKRKPAPPPDDEDEEGDAEPPAKPKKKGEAAPKKSGGGIVLLILLAVLLLLVLCGGGGLAVYYFGLLDFSSNSNVKPTKDKDKGDGNKIDTTPPKETVIEPRARFKADMGVKGDGQEIRTLILSHDGSRAVVINGKYKAQLWDIAGEPKKLRDYDGLYQALSPDGKRLARSTPKGMILEDAESGGEIATLRFGRVWFASDTVMWSLGNSFKDAKGKKKISATSYDAATGKQIKELEIDDKGDRFVPADAAGQVVFISRSREVNIWDASKETFAGLLTLKPDAGSSIMTDSGQLAVGADGKWMVAPTGSGTFDPAAFDLSTGAATKIPKQGMFPRTPAFVPNRDILMVNKSGVFKKDQLAAYDLKTNAVVATFGTVDGSVHSVGISGDGNTMAAGSVEGEVVIWDLRKQK